MAIFSGEDIQRAIDRSGRKIRPSYLQERLPQLRSSDPKHSVAAEWEIVIIDSFSRCGAVEWFSGNEDDPELTTSRSSQPESNPDFLFRPCPSGVLAPFASVLPKELLIEVSAVSDRGYEDANPRRRFFEAFNRLLCEHCMPREMFGVDLKGEMVKPKVTRKPSNIGFFLRPNLDHGKMCLLLPPKNRVEVFVKNYLGPWIQQIRSNPCGPKIFEIDESVEGYRVCLQVRYNPKGEYFSPGSFAGYTETYSIVRNPVANRLSRKVIQIRKSGFEGVTGVFLSDGDCNLLADRGGYGPMTFDLRKVISHFCNQSEHKRISFVVTLSPQDIFTGVRFEGPVTKVQAFFNPNARYPIGEKALSALVRAVCDQLPAPVNTAANAINLIEGIGGFREGLPPRGGFKAEPASCRRVD